LLPKLYTPEEVAEYCKVTRRQVYQWLLKGKLSGLKAGDGWRITEGELLRFLGMPKPMKAKNSRR